jgi:pimeloyl-ACP methyl ester carboxylesterase
VREDEPSGLTRRRVLGGVAGLAGVVAIGGIGIAVAPDRLRSRLGLEPDAFIPDAPEGRVAVERVHSEARGMDVELFTAVPAGHGDGAGLPVVVILHGAKATASDYRDFGFGRFLTRSVRDGAAPFVLAGADGGRLRWEKDPSGVDDPGAMVLDEMPAWLHERGFDAGRRALWGWSMGGYGALRLAERRPSWARGVAVFSPAISQGDAVFEHAARLDAATLACWCGTEDPFHDATRVFVGALAARPAIASFSPGGHTRAYWNDQTLEAFRFLSQRLTG